MAQKAAKQTAKRNSYILNRTHVITAAIHAFFLLCRVVIFRSSSSVSSLVKYTILSAPALVIECIFELNGRPKYTSYAASAELRRSGDDLEAKGLTEWMWDVLYWTWGCTVLVALVGDWAWWLYAIVPLWSIWLAYTTFGNIRSGLMGAQAPPSSQESRNGSLGTSKRQQKLEKRGGQKFDYR